MKLQDVLMWPKKPGNGLNPWWLILWRGIWAVPFVISMCFACTFLWIAQGPDSAAQLWRDAL